MKLVGSFEDGMIMLGRVHVFFDVGFSKDSKEFSGELGALKGKRVVVNITPVDGESA